MTPAVHAAPREWTRLHPVSPFLGGWSVIAAVGAYWFINNAPSWAGGMGDDGGFHPGLIALASVAVVGALFVIGGGFLSWRMRTYRITDAAVELRKGILFRQFMQARLDRLQAVDVVQPLVARIFGFAALRVEVAGGEGSTVALEYLRLADAEALRNEILVLAAGLRTDRSSSGTGGEPPLAPAPSLRDVIPGQGAGVPEFAAAAERDVLRVPLGRLIASIALSGSVLWLALVPIVWLVVVLVWGSNGEQFLLAFVGGSIAAALPILFAFVGVIWSRLSTGFGFVAGISADGVRLRHGLLETRRQTVPPGRVQAVRLRQTLLWRRKDWWRLTVNVAGYQVDQTASVSTLLPVGTRADALTALWLVLPDLGDPDPSGTVSRAMSGVGADGGFVASPRASRWFDPWQWKHRGVRATDTALLIRRGLFVRELMVVPHERTQSIGLSQGPLQRAVGLANVSLHSTPGPVTPVAQHLGLEDAFALVEQQAARARRSRHTQSSEQWMATVAPSLDDVLAADDLTVAPDALTTETPTVTGAEQP